MQGPGTPGEEKELDNIEPLPERALDVSSAKNDALNNLQPEIEVTTAVSKKTSPTDIAIVEENKLPPVMALERELQEIQASINAGGDITPVANVALVGEAQQEYFPSVETTEQKSKLTKSVPFVISL